MHKIYNILEHWSLMHNMIFLSLLDSIEYHQSCNWKQLRGLICLAAVLSRGRVFICCRMYYNGPMSLYLYANVIATTELLKRWQLVVESWQESVFKYSTDRQITKLQLELPKNKNRKLKNHINKRGQVWCAILLALVPRLKVRTTCL